MAVEDGGARVVRVSLRVHAALENRSLAVDLVSTLIAHVEGADAAFANEMITAFGEAFNNVVLHGYREQKDGALDIDAEMSRNTMTLRLSDNGRQIEIADVRAPDLDTMPEGGMGMYMIHAMVDEVTYRAGSPNVLTLTKRVGARP